MAKTVLQGHIGTLWGPWAILGPSWPTWGPRQHAYLLGLENCMWGPPMRDKEGHSNSFELVLTVL